MVKVRAIECEADELENALNGWFNSLGNNVKILNTSQVFTTDGTVITTLWFDEGPMRNIEGYD